MEELTISRRVNDEIQRGLSLCRRSPAPIVALAQFIDDLHADPHWREAEVSLIETTLRRVLARVVRR
jgi:hypothetical protein